MALYPRCLAKAREKRAVGNRTAPSSCCPTATFTPTTTMQAMILAAGFGTRLRPHTLLRPKPLFPVLNRPLLHILLERLLECGCTRLLVNAHHLTGQIKTSLIPYPGVILQEEQRILGTGGALRQALDRLAPEPLVVMNGDILHDLDLEGLLRHHRESSDLVTLALHDHPRFNRVRVKGDRVVGFGGQGPGRRLAFTGIHVLEPSVLERIPQGFFHIIDLYQELAREGRLGHIRVDGCFWRDMGTPEDYLELHRDLLLNSEHPFARQADPGIRMGNWLVADRARIGRKVCLRGWGCLGPESRIGDDVVLENVVVWDGVEVPAGSRLRDTIADGSRKTG